MKHISCDTESQPAASEDEKKEGIRLEEQEKVRRFINTITDVFDYHKEEGDNN